MYVQRRKEKKKKFSDQLSSINFRYYSNQNINEHLEDYKSDKLVFYSY